MCILELTLATQGVGSWNCFESGSAELRFSPPHAITHLLSRHQHPSNP